MNKELDKSNLFNRTYLFNDSVKQISKKNKILQQKKKGEY